MPKTVNVPDITHPTLCYKQKLDAPNAMTRCNRQKHHTGPHSWEFLLNPPDGSD